MSGTQAAAASVGLVCRAGRHCGSRARGRQGSWSLLSLEPRLTPSSTMKACLQGGALRSVSAQVRWETRFVLSYSSSTFYRRASTKWHFKLRVYKLKSYLLIHTLILVQS